MAENGTNEWIRGETDMSKVYLAAPFVYKIYAQRVRSAFEAAGIRVTSRWLDFQLPRGESVASAATLRKEAEYDLEDLNDADALVLLNLEKSEGKAFEQGYAVACGLPVIGIGAPANCVFHHLSWYTWVETVRDAITVIRDLSVQDGLLDPR